jgi:hypothetical protein
MVWEKLKLGQQYMAMDVRDGRFVKRYAPNPELLHLHEPGLQ